MSVTSRQMSRRAILRGIAQGAAAFVAVACSSAAPTAMTVPSTPPPTIVPAIQAAANSKGPITLRIAPSWTGTGEKQIWATLFDAFGKDHPNIKLDLDLSSAQGPYDRNLLAQVAAGTLPDIIYSTDNYVLPFQQNKITQDLLPFAKATKFPIDDFDQTFLDLGMVEGQLHLLPRGGDVVVLMINKKMVADAGVQIPWRTDYTTAKWTQDDFYKVCQRLTVDTSGKRGDEKGFDKTNVSIYGAAINTTWWAVYVPAILAQGGQLVSPDLTKSLLNSPQGVAAFEWLTKPVIDGYWASQSFMSTVGNPFNAGQAAITATVRAAVPGIRTEVKDDWDVAHFYAGPVKRVTGMGTLGFAMSKTTKQPDAAWTWLSWMFDEPGMRIIASNYGSVPVQKRFFNATWWKNLPPPPANNSVFTDAFSYGTLPPRLPFYTTGPFTTALNEGMAAVEQGRSKPADVVKSVDAELTKWLAKAATPIASG